MAQPRLTAWEAITADTDRCCVVVGDSTWGFDGYPFGQAGPGPSSSDYFRQVFAKRWPVRGPGIRICASAFEWTFTTGGNAWTVSTIADAWDCAPYKGIYASAQNATMRANTATKTASWSSAVVAGITSDPITSFKLYVVDGASSGNFSYRIDGGSWTNVSNTWNQNNSLDVITISSAVTSTVEVRGANAAGTAVTMYLVGIEPITGTGAQFHDMSVPGERLRSLIRLTTAGDDLAWVEVLDPDVVYVGFTNDVVLDAIGGSTADWDPSAFAAQLQSLVDRVDANGGTVVPIMYWGQDRAEWDAHSAAMQSIINGIATTSGLPCIDLLDRYGDFDTIEAAGLNVDTLHPSDAGTVEIVRHNTWPILARGT